MEQKFFYLATGIGQIIAVFIMITFAIYFLIKQTIGRRLRSNYEITELRNWITENRIETIRQLIEIQNQLIVIVSNGESVTSIQRNAVEIIKKTIIQMTAEIEETKD